MARKLTWRIPEDDTITKVEISTAANKYGSYTVASTIFATDDEAAKSASNDWVTTYTDPTGVRTNWYKIRFYDGTNFTEFAEPITGEQEVNLCSVDDVTEVIDTVGRFTDADILDAINEVEGFIYSEMGTPIKETYSPIEKYNNTLQDTYYVGEENIFRVDRVFYGTTTKHELFLDDAYKVNEKYGMIRLLPVASGGPTLATTDEVDIRYVPKIINRITTYRTAKFLLEKVNYASHGAVTNELEVIEKKLEMVEKVHMDRIGFALSSQYAGYDGTYGVGRKKVNQDYDRNKYVASYGW